LQLFETNKGASNRARIFRLIVTFILHGDGGKRKIKRDSENPSIHSDKKKIIKKI
jgi:hypothetical protein